MVTIPTRDGPLRVPDATVWAVARHAERQADLTAAYLEATGLFNGKPVQLPAGFLLELAAVLEPGLWERQDLRRHLDVDLPTYREAADQLAARAAKGRAEFDGPDATSLSGRVLQVWIDNFAWDGPELLGTDIVVGHVDEDVFVDVMAKFVWKYRHEIARLLADGEEQ
jgi:hypothetical protein